MIYKAIKLLQNIMILIPGAKVILTNSVASLTKDHII